MQEKAEADAAAAEGTSQMWVAQKCIEQPLIINRRYPTLDQKKLCRRTCLTMHRHLRHARAYSSIHENHLHRKHTHHRHAQTPPDQLSQNIILYIQSSTLQKLT